MDDQSLKILEKYVLNSFQEKILNELTPGGDLYLYYKCLHILNVRPKSIEKEDMEILRKYSEGYSTNNRIIALKKLLIEYDNAIDKGLRERILNQLNDKFIGADLKVEKLIRVNENKKLTKKEIEKLEEIPNTLDISGNFDQKKQLEILYLKKNEYYNFSQTILINIDFGKFNENEFYSILNYLGKSVICCNSKSFYKSYKQCLKTHYDLYSRNFQLLSIEQMDQLRSYISEFKQNIEFEGCYLQKVFANELIGNDKNFSAAHKRQILTKLLIYSKNHLSQFKNLRTCILQELLVNGIDTNIYDKKYFIDYIKGPSSSDFIEKQQYFFTSDWQRFIENVRSSIKPNSYYIDKNLYKRYLARFFKEGAKINEFQGYLKKEFLNLVMEETMISLGKQINNDSPNFKLLQGFSQLVELNICNHNKEEFLPSDPVVIDVDIKNIQELYVRIFEINLENYYRKYMDSFKTDINLDGICAEETLYNYSKFLPQMRHTETFEFPSLKEKKGLFLIDFIGNSKSSRAVIKKGNLSVITQWTIAGHFCYIIDHNKEICNSDSTAIYLDGNLFKPDREQNGRIIIPYSQNEHTSKAILLHEGLAQLVDFRRREEEYKFDCGFILHSESLIWGNRTSILARPILKCCGFKSPLEIMKNSRFKIIMTNFVEKIPIIKTFDNVEITYDKEILLNFQVIPNLSTLKVYFSTTVHNNSKNIDQNFNVEKEFIIETHSEDLLNYELFLRYFNNEYAIYLFGKNGEPKENCCINLDVKFKNYFKPTSFCLKTDSKGGCYLGNLQEVSEISAYVHLEAFKNRKICRSWKIPEKAVQYNSTKYKLLEGENISFDITKSDSEKIIFLSIKGSYSLNKMNEKLIIQKGKFYNKIEIKDLPVGEYLLFSPNSFEMSIEICKGKLWIDNLLLLDNGILERQQNIDIPKVVDVTYSEDNKTLILKINSLKKDIRVHLFAYQFTPNEANLFSDQLNKIISNQKFILSSFQQWNNFYLSGRELGSELRYILDRKNAEKIIGNTQEKPRLLLKRQFVRETTTGKEELIEGKKFEKKVERVVDQTKITDIKISTSEDKRSAKQKNKPYKRFENNEKSYSFQNFLSIAPLTIFNMIPNDNKEVLIQQDLTEYSTILALVVDSSGASSIIHPIKNSINPLNKKDLSQKSVLDINKNYAQSRCIFHIQKSENFIINDITISEIQIVDSLNKVFRILKEVSKYFSIPQENVEKFEPLLKWHSLNNEERLKLLSGLFSHEFNLFIFKKDRTFFDLIIKPYISNKIDKSFIDYYLLQDFEQLLRYINIVKYNTLNYMEKVLLIEAFSNHNIELSNIIFQDLKTEFELFQTNSMMEDKIFDMIMNFDSGSSQNLDLVQEIKIDANLILNKKIPKTGEVIQNDDEPKYKETGPKKKFKRVELFENDDSEDPMKNNILDVEKAGNIINRNYNIDELRSIAAKQIKKFTETESTNEYVETHYFSVNNVNETSNLIRGGIQFWFDYAFHIKQNSGKPFLSKKFLHCFQNLTEIFGALSFLDLPFDSQEHGYRTLEGKKAEIKAMDNLFIFSKEIKEVERNEEMSIILAHKYFYPENPNSDYNIIDFLPFQTYGCELITTNISNKKTEINVFYQIPQTSVPMGQTSSERSFQVVLEPFTTQTFKYYFYFSDFGNFIHFPAMASINSVVISKDKLTNINVVKLKKIISVDSWMDTINSGSQKDILEFIKYKNLKKSDLGFNLSSIYYLLDDKKFFDSLISLLRSKFMFDKKVWQFSLLHKDELGIREYIHNTHCFDQFLGKFFKSKLANISPDDINMRHLDYYPLINPRVHSLKTTKSSFILNKEFRNTYENYLIYLAERHFITTQDLMILTYYLLLQERIKEAVNLFNKINPEIMTEGQLKIQYDYMNSYIDFLTGFPKFEKASIILDHYLKYPVFIWKSLFDNMRFQLEEFKGTGKEEKISNEEIQNKERNKEASIIKTPSLEFKIFNENIIIDHRNIKTIEIKHYLIDLEMMFSRSPFLKIIGEQCSYVVPHKIEKISLDPEGISYISKISNEFLKYNSIIEVLGAGIQKFETFLSSKIEVEIFENYGELKVLDKSRKAVIKAYVKAYIIKKNDEIYFYKDGYTDFRGIFNYALLNSNEMSNIQKFSLLILSEEHGALIRECNPPNSDLSLSF